jgi:hypothetical protein
MSGAMHEVMAKQLVADHQRAVHEQANIHRQLAEASSAQPRRRRITAPLRSLRRLVARPLNTTDKSGAVAPAVYPQPRSTP